MSLLVQDGAAGNRSTVGARGTAAHVVADARGRIKPLVGAQVHQCRRRTRKTRAPAVAQFGARRTIRSNTGCGSPGEADIAFSTSMVADCCSIRSPYSLLRVPVRQSAWPAPQPVWPPVPAPRRVLAAVPRWRVEVRRSCRLVSRSLAVTTPRSMQKRDRHASGPGQSRGHVSPWLARPVTCGLPAGSDAKPSQRVDPNLPLRDTCCERPLRVAFGRSLGAPCPGFTLPMRRRTLDSMFSPKLCRSPLRPAYGLARSRVYPGAYAADSWRGRWGSDRWRVSQPTYAHRRRRWRRGRSLGAIL